MEHVEHVDTPILRRIEDHIHRKGYRIDKINNANDVLFYIYHDKTLISEIELHVTDGNVLIGKTRTSYATLVEVPVFNVSWLSTNKQYEGQQLGSLLLMYALCDLKIHNPNVNYAILDDDTDKSRSMKNIYNKLGFSFRDFVCLGDKKGEVEMSGPEKQVELNDDFISCVIQKLDKLTGGRKKSRKYKRRNKYTINRRRCQTRPN